MRNPILLLSVAALLSASLSAQSSLTFDFDTDGNTEGFSGVNVSGLEASGGFLTGTADNGDPRLERTSTSDTGPPLFSKEPAATWQQIVFRVRETDNETDSVVTPFNAQGLVVVLNDIDTGANQGNRQIFSGDLLTAEDSGDGFFTITADISGFTPDDVRYLRVDPIGAPDASGNTFEVDFITVEVDGNFALSEIEVVETVPTGEAPPNGALFLTLSQNVLPGTGDLTVHRADDDTVVETIDVTSENVIIDGPSVTVAPTVPLDFGTSYYVLIDAGAFADNAGSVFPGIDDPSAWTFTTLGEDPALLFADSFERPAGSDLNASDLGKYGALGALNYTSRAVGAGNVEISSRQLLVQSNEPSGSSGGLVYINDHNFTDAAITAGGGFSVTVDINAYFSQGSGRHMSVGVGQSLAELDALDSASGPGSVGDLVVGYRNTTGDLEIFRNGTLDAEATVTGGLPAPPTTLRIDYALSDFEAGSTVSYDVFFDDAETPFTSGTFTWSGTNENYLSLSSNAFEGPSPGVENSLFDDLRIRANAVIEPLALKISRNSGLLDFEWNGLSGKQYDLVSSTELSASPATWSPYDDGTTTYENILSTGNGTNALTGVQPLGPRRFFALVEEDIQPLYSEDFESGDGGYSATVADGTAWAHGNPDSSGFGGQAVTEGNGGSANCWGTDIENPGHYDNPTTDSCLRSPVIDLTDVGRATLSFAQVLDIAGGDGGEVRIIDDSTGEPIASGPFPLTITDDDIETSDWTVSGPHELPVGGMIRIEWCFSGTGGSSNDFMGWYVDDVVVMPGTP